MIHEPGADGQVDIFASDEQPALLLFYLDREEVCLRYRYGFRTETEGSKPWIVLDCRGRLVARLADYSGDLLRQRGYYEDRQEALAALLVLMQERLETISARRALVERELAEARAAGTTVR